MESNGEKGRVLVSERTKELLETKYNHFIFEKKAEDVVCKSINQVVPAYFVSLDINKMEEINGKEENVNNDQIIQI